MFCHERSCRNFQTGMFLLIPNCDTSQSCICLDMESKSELARPRLFASRPIFSLYSLACRESVLPLLTCSWCWLKRLERLDWDFWFRELFQSMFDQKAWPLHADRWRDYQSKLLSAWGLQPIFLLAGRSAGKFWPRWLRPSSFESDRSHSCYCQCLDRYFQCNWKICLWFLYP